MKRKVFIMTVLFGVVLGLFGFQPVSAADSEPSTVMRVAPVVEELELKPGAQAEKIIKVSNTDSKELKVRVYSSPYSFSAANASDFQTQSEFTQISHWLKIQNDDSQYVDEAAFTIEPSATVDVKYRIEVPESAPGGSQHAVIFIETVPEDRPESSGVTTISRTAVKIFANVAGETKIDVTVSDLRASTMVINGNRKQARRVRDRAKRKTDDGGRRD